MKKLIKYMAVILLTAAVFSACKKDPEPVGGKGGNAMLRVITKHHAKYIDSCMVYIKYDAQDMPSSFDDSARVVVNTDSIPVATFPGLKKGKYYLYGDGWDPNIAMEVKGGAPYKITEEKTQDVTLYVTEGD